MSDYVDANFTKKHLADGRTKVINVLAADTYEKQHIPGSLNLPEDDPQFAQKAQQLVPDKSTPLIVHCTGMACQASTKAARKLESLGYEEVHDFKAGLEGWEQAGNAFEAGKGTTTPTPGPAGETPPAQQAHGEKGVERPPRPGREQGSHREEQRTTETKQA